jgi:putative transposase
MVNMIQKKVENHLSNDELNKLIKSKKNDCKMFQKLIFIRAVKNGEKVSDACAFLQISEPTGHRWLDNYNEEGLAGLEPKSHNAGRPSKLSDEQKEELYKIIENEDNLTVQRAHQIIKDRYNVDYSLRQVKRIIKALNFNYGKPYQIYSQKPKDAELQLKKI